VQPSIAPGTQHTQGRCARGVGRRDRGGFQGRSREYLTKSDFEIYEDDIAQEVRFFSPVSTPYNVFLLFDSSDSTRDNLDFMVQAAAELIVNLRPEDKLAIASFDDNFKLHLAWSTDRTKAMTALRQMIQPHESNETRFYAALDRTVRRELASPQ
jgi:von Willebrand factor type A domain